jgi:NADH:ubiquinone oxidoreductase subunit D
MVKTVPSISIPDMAALHRGALRVHACMPIYFRVGGVHQDLPPKLLDDIWAFCDPFLQVCDDLEGLLEATLATTHGLQKFRSPRRFAPRPH